MSDIRIGKISGIDYGNGMVKVTYEDKNNAVSPWLSYFQFNGEYKMPLIGQNVIVLVTMNGQGVVLGGYFNKKVSNISAKGKGIFIKELAEKEGNAFISYDHNTLKMQIAAGIVEIICSGKVISVAELAEKVDKIWEKLEM